jgi:signal transduction histidine kinase
MDGSINESQQESLKKIEKSAFHLLNLIDDILDWSKIEAKKMELEITPQNIVEVVLSSIEEIQSLAEQKQLDFYLSTTHSFILVEMDRVRIRQVLLNLLSNAIKFTEKGFIKVSLFNAPQEAHIQITDTGIGLSEDEIEKIFRPFSQADSSITRKYGGTGLGLVISKNIIDLHGGTISVESQKGQGSSFTITLPKMQ